MIIVMLILNYIISSIGTQPLHTSHPPFILYSPFALTEHLYANIFNIIDSLLTVIDYNKSCLYLFVVVAVMYFEVEPLVETYGVCVTG